MPDGDSSVNIQCDVYDTEIPKIEHVIEILNTRAGKLANLEDYRREIVGRFEEIGFRVDVRCYETNVGAVWYDIDIVARLDNQPMDRDRQVYEATHDVLNLGTGGVIKSPSGLIVPSHSHGHGHSHHH